MELYQITQPPRLSVLTRQSNAKVLQRCASEFLRRTADTAMKRAGCRVVRVGRGFLGRLRAKRVARGVARLQAVKRGQKTSIQTDATVRFIRKRLALANKTARERPEMALGKRCESALDALRNSKCLAVVMSVMRTLESDSWKLRKQTPVSETTQHSELCCEMFARREAPRILLDLVRDCDRSPPHVELQNGVLRTICNVAKHEHLVESVARDIAVDTLMDLLQTFYVNENIMALCCDLLVVVCTADLLCMATIQSGEYYSRARCILNLVESRARLGLMKSQEECWLWWGEKKKVPTGLRAMQRFVAVLDEFAGGEKENMIV